MVVALWFAVLASALVFVYAWPSPVIGQLAGDKAGYVGSWRSPTLDLRIDQDGVIEYSRQYEHSGTHAGGKIWAFDGDDVRVLMPPIFPGRFHVTEPPHLADGQWRMVVDGVSVTKNGSGT